MPKRFFHFAICLSALLILNACDEKESDLGVDLQDPSTLYEGIVDTAYGTAMTVYDDSLLTSGQSSVLVGCYSDPVFGTSEGIYYTQITTANDAGVEFDQNSIIDSAVLSFAVSDIYTSASSSKGYRDLHFEIYQLAESPMKDTAYYATDELTVTNNCLFDDVVRVVQSDTMVASMKLGDNFISQISNCSYSSSAEFAEAIKGMRVRLVNDGTPVMATLNLAASNTRIRVYYKYVNGEETISRTYDFDVSNSAPHFNGYKNNFAGPLATFNTNTSDSIDGSRYLYLSPMGGANIKLNFNAFVQQFRQQHPYAIIHYAELLLPVADISPADKPSMIVALKCFNDGTVVNIPDMYDAYTSSGFDGKYDSGNGYYRLRVTQHFQKLVKSGMDLGTLLLINGRRSSALRTVINGCDATLTGNNPVRIQFVYSE